MNCWRLCRTQECTWINKGRSTTMMMEAHTNFSGQPPCQSSLLDLTTHWIEDLRCWFLHVVWCHTNMNLFKVVCRSGVCRLSVGIFWRNFRNRQQVVAFGRRLQHSSPPGLPLKTMKVWWLGCKCLANSGHFQKTVAVSNYLAMIENQFQKYFGSQSGPFPTIHGNKQQDELTAAVAVRAGLLAQSMECPPGDNHNKFLDKSTMPRFSHWICISRWGTIIKAVLGIVGCLLVSLGGWRSWTANHQPLTFFVI